VRDDRGLGVNVCMEVTVLNVSQSTKTCLKLILGVAESHGKMARNSMMEN
jgi:hypothetical protein